MAPPTPMQKCRIKVERSEFFLTDTSLAAKFKRFFEQINLFRELVLRLSVGLDMMEAENQSLKSSQHFRRGKFGGKFKETSKSEESSPKAIRFIIQAITEAVDRVESRLQEVEFAFMEEKKLVETAREEINREKQQHDKTKDLLNNVQQKLELHHDKTEKLKEKIELMEHCIIKESNRRIQAEKRANCLQNENAELKEALGDLRPKVNPGLSSKTSPSVSENEAPAVQESVPDGSCGQQLSAPKRARFFYQAFSIQRLRQTTIGVGERAVSLANRVTERLSLRYEAAIKSSFKNALGRTRGLFSCGMPAALRAPGLMEARP